MPAAISSVGIQIGLASLIVNSSRVAFVGYEWWVIGDATSGVYPQSGHVTLFSANDDFGESAFRDGNFSEVDGYTAHKFGPILYYYANNPTGMTEWTTPNEYAGSTLQQGMESIANTINKTSSKEYAAITARTLASEATVDNNKWSSEKIDYDYIDGIAGQGAADQKLWALSRAEAKAINNKDMISYGNRYWWLRSPGFTAHYVALGHYNSYINSVGNVNANYDAVWPALSLNLSSILFTSAASESGKSSATAGGDLVSAETPTGTVKFTMTDSTQTLNLCVTKEQSTQKGETLAFDYSNATTGTNQYVSCVLTDSDGAAAYYGKLKDCSEENAASGTVSIPLTGITDGTYTLKIFSEEANGDTYTDFCSEPVTVNVTVSDGKGAVQHDHTGGTAACKDAAKGIKKADTVTAKENTAAE